MSKKNIALITVLAVLGAIYFYRFTGLFQKSEIEISSRVRPSFSRRGKTPPSPMISFSLNDKYALTSVKVVEESDFKTNKYPHALWHLVSESNSVPTKMIVYGSSIPGMKTEYAKSKPEVLQHNSNYILLLETKELKGQSTFRAP